MVLSTKTLYLVSFLLAILLDMIVSVYCKNTKFYNKYLNILNKFDYFNLFLIIFIFILTVFSLCNYILDINIITVTFESYNFNFFDTASSENIGSSNSSINSGSVISGNNVEGTVVLNNPNLTAKVPVKGLNNIAAALSSTGGATLGFKVARTIAGPPSVKILGGVGVMAGVQATTAITAAVLNHVSGNINTSSDVHNTNKLYFLANSYTDKGVNLLNDSFGDLLIKNYSDYPLSLLFEINRLINIEILFVFILINIIIIQNLNKIDYKKYFSESKISKIILFFLERYINTWSKLSKVVIYIAIISIIYCIILSKIALILISASS